MLPGVDAARNGDVELVGAQRYAPVAIGFGRAQRDRAGGAVVGIFQIDHDLGVTVFAPRVKIGARPAATGKAMSVQRFEEVAEIRCLGALRTIAGKLEAGVPVRRRAEILPRFPVAAQLVVGGTLFEILEYRIGLAQFLETDLGGKVLADIGMIFAGQLAIRAADLVLGGIACHPHDLVVVLEFHSGPFRR